MLALWESIKVFLKGIIMGAANVFPISSGTVSLVLGVFERFINSINSLRIKNFKLLFKGEFSQFGKRTDFRFFITIALGLLAGMVLTSIFLKQTLVSYKVYTWSFFIGLIIASISSSAVLSVPRAWWFQAFQDRTSCCLWATTN